jgi:predicted metal-dependent HD superfamily phosphohydrolase
MKDGTNKDLLIAENHHLLKLSWGRCWKSIDAAGDGDALMRRLVTAYNEPQRKYHTIQHLTDCLLLLDENLGLAIEPAEVEVALWFHDAIYNVKRSDNEAQSAEWAARELHQAGVSSKRIARVKDNILATRHSARPQGQDQMLLVDIDLSILGAPRARFEEYERQVRAEYGWVPGFIFSRKRREVLSEFLSRNVIYNTPKLHEAFEDQARANLAYSVQQLRG